MTDNNPNPEKQRPGLAKRYGFWLGMVAFLVVLLFTDLDPDNPLVTRMASVAVLMAVWWITEAIPLAATSLVPLVAFPLLGLMKGKETAPIYVNYIIFLFVGGFMIALAMEKWNLHKRIALWIIRTVGGGPNRLVLSFMIASAFLSMWISNTATAIMMLAIGLAIIKEQEAVFGHQRMHNLNIALLLGIAYGSSIGGIATLVGTPPNLSFVRIFEQTFPKAEPVAFGQWMLLGLPLSILMLLITWLLLTQVFFRSPADLRLSREVVVKEYRALGKISFAESCVLAVFTCTALLWVFREDLNVGVFTLPGWSRLIPNAAPFIDDGTVAIGMALTLFFIPSRAHGEGANPRLLSAGVFRDIPWHVVLLFGGGFALASGIGTSGLSVWIGQHFEALAGSSPLVMTAAVCGVMTFLTELTSNTATTEMALPILSSVAVAMDTHPLLLMIPATLSASFAFMMPVATPPNSIVFSSGRIRVVDMVKIGIVINLIGVVVVTALFLTLGETVFNIDPDHLPAWATEAASHSSPTSNPPPSK